MEQMPNIIMKCPRCSKEYPTNLSYCDACSVMLEPVEVETVVPETEMNDAGPSGSIAFQNKEILEDVKIDNLKADIETKFVTTLLKERDQLKRRLSRKGKSLSEFQNKKSGIEQSDLSAEFNVREKEIEDIAGKISRIEAMLDNLKGKIEEDISELNKKINDVKRPGILWFMHEDGRYCKMISSELRTKNILMDIISGRKSREYFNLMRLGRLFILLVLTSVLSLIVSRYYFTGNYIEKKAQPPAVRKEDITSLLDDIRKANLNKDLVLWESRYSRSYLESGGRRENQTEQWKKFDFRQLSYRIDDLKMGADSASAAITWEIELLSRQKNEAKILTQTLYANFITEDGRLKINSVRKKEE